MIKYVILLIMLLNVNLTYGQGAIKKQRKLNENIFFGAGLGLQFGTITAVEISPMVGYRPINNMSLGLRGKYEYYSNSNYNQATTIYGGSVFATYAFFKHVLAYTEYEALNLESFYFDPQQTNERFWVHTPIVGGGYLQTIGERSGIMILLLWNLNNSYNYYYSNPELRISFLF